MNNIYNIERSLSSLGETRIRHKCTPKEFILTQDDISGFRQGMRAQLSKNAAARDASAVAASKRSLA